MSLVAGNDFVDMLKLFSDKEELARRIESFERSKKDAEAAIALAGPASEILKLREQAARDAEAARERVTQANNEGAVILARAKERAEQMMQEASTMVDQQLVLRDEAKEQAEVLTRVAIERANEADALMKEALRTKAEAEKLLKDARDALLEAQAKQDDYELRKQALLRRVAEFRAELGGK